MLINHDPGLWRDLACSYAAKLLDERVKSMPPNWKSIATGHIYSNQPCDYGRVFSDCLHRSLLSASLEVRPEWTQLQNVDVEETGELSVQEFVNRYESKGKPVLIRGFTHLFEKGLNRWKDGLQKGLSSLHDLETKFRCGPCDLSILSFKKYCEQIAEVDENPLYIFDAKFAEKFPELAQDYQVPPFFVGENRDLFAHMPSARRPDYRWVIGGAKYSCSKHHVDPNCTNAWNVSLL